MIYTDNDLKYLKGESFSARYDMQLVPNKLVWRIERIVDMCTDKKVLHIGCCDHISVIEQKNKDNIWLHGLLDHRCKYLQGVDVCREAVDYCNVKKLCSVPIVMGDCTSCHIDELENFDVVLMAEMIEHVNNPVDFLERTRRNFEKQGFKGKYILTAPNALGVMRRNVFSKSIERINSDHKYWFSPFTLAKIMVEAGINPESCEFVQYAPCEEEETTYKSDAIIVVGH